MTCEPNTQMARTHISNLIFTLSLFWKKIQSSIVNRRPSVNTLFNGNTFPFKYFVFIFGIGFIWILSRMLLKLCYVASKYRCIVWRSCYFIPLAHCGPAWAFILKLTDYFLCLSYVLHICKKIMWLQNEEVKFSPYKAVLAVSTLYESSFIF